MAKPLFLIPLLFFFNSLSAQSLKPASFYKDRDPAAIVELGGAPNWDLKKGNATLAPTVAIEFTPIKENLEIEIGASPYYSSSGYNWQFDILFKKPYDISKKIEIMFGAGPQWSFTNQSTLVSGEIAADLMYWPFKKKIGFYVEPNYDYGFTRAHEQSIGIDAGIIIAVN